MMSESWLYVDEIGEHLGVNLDTIHNWVIRKSVPAHKLGLIWKFLASEIENPFLEMTRGELSIRRTCESPFPTKGGQDE